MPIVIATTNKHKFREIKPILSSCRLQSRNIKPLYIYKNVPEVIEDGKTLKANAVKKAVSCAEFTGQISLGDDTGLEVKALHGSPGVFSARYAGPHATYEDNNRKLLSALKSVPMSKRQAVFKCVVAVAWPKGKVKVVEGSLKGVICEKPRGKNGFGYDPVFYIPRFKKTMAALSAKEKNAISHRFQAFKKAAAILLKQHGV